MVMLSLLAALVVAALAFASYMFKVVNEYERGVRFTFGKYDRVMEPGLRIVVPFVQTWHRVDMRVKAVDVPKQESITKDNVTVSINAVIYYKVRDAEKAVIEVERYMYAVKQLAQTTMRNVVGQVDLDELLARRDKIAKQIREVIDEQTDPWGIDVHSVELKDIILAEDMKRVLARQAEAERERRAVTIQAEGEKEAAQNMADAAQILSERSGALHLRTLQTLASLSSDHSNTVVFTVPMEVLEAVKGIGQAAPQRPDTTADSAPVESNGSSSGTASAA
ncbi:MAG: slipin family protein [Bacteroidetes bacterium]|jgi:regulator of protease activity HflC (stomatin/prohibitin superfamily)|nr:slipin family protein [Bacteroidota bacterium]